MYDLYMMISLWCTRGYACSRLPC